MLSLANAVWVIYLNTVYVLFGNVDIGWLIALGDYTLKHGIPDKLIYSWTAPDRPMVSYQWLFEVAVAKIHEWGGFLLLGAVSAFVTGVIYLGILPLTWIRRGLPLAVPYLFVPLLMSGAGFYARPQLVSELLMIIFILILEKFRTDPQSRLIYLLPVLMVFWANVHVFFVFGILVEVIYLIGIWSRKLGSAEPGSAGSQPATSRLLPLLVVIALSALATLCNPVGFKLLAYLLVFSSPETATGIQELKPALTPPLNKPILLFFLLSWIVIVWRRKHIPREGIVLGLILTALAFQVRRFEALASMSLWPYLGYALADAIDWQKFHLVSWSDASLKFKFLSGHGLTPQRAQIVAVLLSGLVGAACWIASFPTEQSARSGVLSSEPILQFFMSHTTDRDRLFNDGTVGSWLEYLGFQKVFVDSRYSTFPGSVVVDHVTILDVDPGWKEKLKEYGITEFLLINSCQLADVLLILPDWTLVLDDGFLSYWVHQDFQHSDSVEKWHLTDNEIMSSDLPPKVKIRTLAKRYIKCIDTAQASAANGNRDEAQKLIERSKKILAIDREVRAAVVKTNYQGVVMGHDTRNGAPPDFTKPE